MGMMLAGRSAWRRRLVVGAVFVVATLLMFRPTPHDIATTVPGNVVDSSLNTWALMWGNHALIHQPLAYFDASIFWPHSYAIAYSEVILPVVPLFGLIHLVTGNPLTALNVSLLALTIFCLSTTYCLARRFTGRTDASVFAALAYTFSGFVFDHVVHIQLMTLGFFPLAFLLLFKMLDERRLWIAVAFGVVTAALVSGSLYYGAVFALCAGVVVVGDLVFHRFRPGAGYLRTIGTAAAVGGLLLLPVALPYVRLHDEQDLTRRLVNEYGLNAEDIVAPAPGSYLYKGLADANLRRLQPYEHVFFPGFSTMALAAVGVTVVLWRRLGAGVVRHRREVALLLGVAVVTVVIAIGPTFFGQPAPFRLLYYHVPAFNGIRASARLAVPALLVGAVLAGIGLAAVVRWVASALGPDRARVAQWALPVVLCAFVLLELAAPFPRERLDTSAPMMAVYHELERRPDGIVAELPIIDPRTQPSEWGYVEAPRMVRATGDWKPRVNGYSGAWPGDYFANLEAVNQFPDPAALERLDDLGVRYVVLHVGPAHFVQQFTEQEAQAIVDHLPPGATASRHGEAWLVDLGPSPERARAARTRD